MSLDLSLTHHAKINSKWIADLNVIHKTFRVRKNRVCDLRLGRVFRLGIKTTIHESKKKKKINKLHLIKFKTFAL